MRRRELRVGERVGGVLVDAALVDGRLDAEAVEQPAQQRGLDHDAGEAERAERLQMNLVESSGQIVAEHAWAKLAEAVGMGIGELALIAKARERGAQLLRLGQARAGVIEARDQSGDARVERGLIERRDQLDQG